MKKTNIIPKEYQRFHKVICKKFKFLNIRPVYNTIGGKINFFIFSKDLLKLNKTKFEDFVKYFWDLSTLEIEFKYNLKLEYIHLVFEQYLNSSCNFY